MVHKVQWRNLRISTQTGSRRPLWMKRDSWLKFIFNMKNLKTNCKAALRGQCLIQQLYVSYLVNFSSRTSHTNILQRYSYVQLNVAGIPIEKALQVK